MEMIGQYLCKDFPKGHMKSHACFASILVVVCHICFPLASYSLNISFSLLPFFSTPSFSLLSITYRWSVMWETKERIKTNAEELERT